MKTKIQFIALIMSSFLFVNCNNDDDVVTPMTEVEITTDESSYSKTYTTIEISGKVSSVGQISERGLCWDTSPHPSVNDDKMIASSDDFTLNVENLTANTTYYFRAYAEENNQITYGDDKIFSTSSLNDTEWLAEFGYTQIPGFTIDAIFSFYSDGTTKYDEVDEPGVFTEYGKWSLQGNTVTYQMSDDMPDDYIFTGELNENTLSGTFIFGAYDDNWFHSELIQ